MRPWIRNTLIVAVAALAASAGYLAQRNASSSTSGQPYAARNAGAPILALTLPDSNGGLQALEQWRGKVLVVNFWATWCPPCLREIPDFARVSERFSGAAVQFVGISIDKPDNVRKFADELKVPYPLLIAPLQTLELTTPLGNTAQALPFTAIFDRRGGLQLIKLGTLNEVELEGKIRALLAEP
ncbi:redoxin domain-containing protein [Aromatoleum diolicum]|uniref:Redoxin domain-containing protein n=2 Tax=Aromatoleum diolicum TaxID=75796 RepID=A0ABX1QGH2_9RHOO|nr:TlpA disulfide reductase family protein [Aromatoleum diolicum]NMG76091.1 redoxin domain-containing protein [Aromatoleum diolicum]